MSVKQPWSSFVVTLVDFPCSECDPSPVYDKCKYKLQVQVQVLESSQHNTCMSLVVTMDKYERVQVTSRQEWRDWLTQHHTQKESIWLVTFKKHTGNNRHLPYSDMVEEALCFGWIDSSIRKVDDDRTMHLVSPRRRRSVWSSLNKDRVQKLQRQGLMTAAGQAVIDRALQDASWSFLDDVEAMVIPPDLDRALQANVKAKRHFEAFSDAVKKQTLQFIKSAKQASTRAKRIQKTVDMAKENKRFTG